MNQHNAKEYLPLIEALANGKMLEFSSNKKDWREMIGDISFEFPPDFYRLKLEPVPLSMEDVSPGSVIRRKNGSGWTLVVGAKPSGITVHTLTRIGDRSTSDAEFMPWTRLAAEHEIMRPGSSIWEPCLRPAA